MNNQQIGGLIKQIRLEKNLTQQQLADALGVTDKAVSKWVRGLGAPELSLLNILSETLGVNLSNLLVGDISPSDAVAGNMKHAKYFVCPICNNITISTGASSVSCC